MFVQAFNAMSARTEYIRLKNVSNVYLEGEHEDSNYCLLMLKVENDESEYILKCFCVKEEMDENPDLKLPDSFYVYVKNQVEVLAISREYLHKFMNKHFKVDSTINELLKELID